MDYENTDLRRLPKEQRPDPTTGQSGPIMELPHASLNKHEAKVVAALDGDGAGPRGTVSVDDLATKTKLSKLQVRNAMRRLVRGRWAERAASVLTDAGEEKEARGHYRITDAGRKRLKRVE